MHTIVDVTVSGRSTSFTVLPIFSIVCTHRLWMQPTRRSTGLPSCGSATVGQATTWMEEAEEGRRFGVIFTQSLEECNEIEGAMACTGSMSEIILRCSNKSLVMSVCSNSFASLQIRFVKPRDPSLLRVPVRFSIRAISFLKLFCQQLPSP